MWKVLYFVKIVSEMVLERDPTTEMIKAFKLFDDDESGKISYRNLKKVARFPLLSETCLVYSWFLCRELGETLSDHEIRAMIEEFDKDGDGSSYY